MEKHLLIESPEHYYSDELQKFMEYERKKPSKQWIQNVLQGIQEKECVKIDSTDYLLLPDTEKINRYASVQPRKSTMDTANTKNLTINWLAIVKDSNLRTIRDLREEHIQMLKKLHTECLQKITEETGVDANKIMAYFHYHPSVYHLHIHFAYPYMQYNQKDILRIHPLHAVINNLSLCKEYYRNSDIHVSCNKDSVLYKVIMSKKDSTNSI